jgi:hypothetical protein
MVIPEIFSSEVQRFILDHENDDDRSIVLRQKFIHGVPSNIVAHQITGRRKAKEKLPLYYHTPNIIYPPTVNLEQSSSEQTAIYKGQILKEVLHSEHATAQQGVDLTGGFGIDTYFLSKRFSHFHSIEPNADLIDIAKHNHKQLGVDNVKYHNVTAERFLNDLTYPVDLVFIDPSRRLQTKKITTLADSEPDVISLQHIIFEKTDRLLIKASPLLDISLGTKELKFVKKVFVVAVENEVKELLFCCEKGFNQEPLVSAVNLKTNDQRFDFYVSEENSTEAQPGDPFTYLYEPNASILKAGAFKTVSRVFDLHKLHPNTHLYTSDQLLNDFPGRVFKIVAHVKPDSKILKQFLPDLKANVVTRNYPLSVEELKEKTKLRDGGNDYVFGFTTVKQKLLVIAERLK